MAMTTETARPLVQLTDPAPLPTTPDSRCPQCRATERERVMMHAFGGQPRQVCGACGHEWPPETV